ncbi:hypothetical protein SAICODRAFT_31832 [Saitoella complicata NRRL Y-17804]|nr:uncharacterized protein SAICODRAFT_31832 [Saitoella complicata NRRL Y-17804]ODQ50538.1 hypothetical protein SAICODRAFT_31832 [Saitoella complicata NRRL Y-17804]
MWQQMRMNQGSGLAGAGLAGVGRGLGGAGQGGDESMTPPGVIRPPETGAETGMLGSYPPPQTITASLRAQQAQHAQHAQVADWVHQQLPRQNQMQQGSEIQVLASPTGHVPVTLYRRQQQQEAMVGTTAQWNSPPYVRPAAGTTALGMARGNSGENTEKEE